MKRLRRIVALLLVLCMLPLSSVESQAKTKEQKGYVIKVNLGTNCVTVYDKKGKPVKAMTCSPGKATPVGTFYTPVKYRWHEMVGHCYAQYCTRITQGFLFHSVWYYKRNDKSSMSVRAYNLMGQTDSLGCVRLLCDDAKWIYENCALKTKVVIFRGKKKDDPLGKPSFQKLDASFRTSWDPTDPDPQNPYVKNRPTIKVKKKTLEYNSKVNEKTAATFKDYQGKKLTTKNAKITISGKINTKKLGTYKIRYKVQDKRGYTKTQSFTFRVVDTKAPRLKGVTSKKDIKVKKSVNLMSGVSASMVSGKKLTSKIKVKVKNIATGKSVKVKKGKVTFTKAGKYRVTYQVTGTNKKTTTRTVTYRVVEPKVEKPKVDTPTVDTPTVDTPTVDTPATGEPNQDTQRAEDTAA